MSKIALRTFVPIIVAVLLLGSSAAAETVGYWRMDDTGAVAGTAITTTASEVNAASLAGTGYNNALYTSDVPGLQIGDPTTGTVYSNALSLDASNNNAQIQINNYSLLDVDSGGDKSFTVEFFMKLVGEPVSYDSFVRRYETVPNLDWQTGEPTSFGRRWQIDFSSGDNASNYGQIRSRWDTTDGFGYTDYNNVTTGARVFVDTDTGSGNPADYTDASGDVQDEGDALNDDTSWHHYALVYDGMTGRFRIWTDYAPGSLKTLAGDFVHPDGSLLFGKTQNNGYGLLIDEFRYSAGALTPDQFLQVVPEPGAWTLLLAGLGCAAMLRWTRRRRRNRG